MQNDDAARVRTTTDTHNLLATEARILQEDEDYIVVAVRIEKATLFRNALLISALAERASSDEAEPNAPREVPVLVRAAIVAAPTAAAAVAKLPVLHALFVWAISPIGLAVNWLTTLAGLVF